MVMRSPGGGALSSLTPSVGAVQVQGSAGVVKCWGMGRVLGYGDTNARGDLPNSMGDSLSYVDLGTGRTAVVLASLKMSPAGGHTCALLDNDAVKCWGENVFGHLGYGDQTSRGNMPNQMGDNLPEVDLGSA